MIIDRKKNILNEILKIKKTILKIESNNYLSERMIFSQICNSMNINKIKLYTENKFLNRLLNKPIYNQEKLINAFRAGYIPNTSKDIYMTNNRYRISIVDSPEVENKASLKYAKRILDNDEKIFYVSNDQLSFENIKSYINNKKINCVFLKKICLRIYNINDSINKLSSLLKLMIISNEEGYNLYKDIKKNNKDIKYYLSLLIGNYYKNKEIILELSQEGIIIFINNLLSDFSSFTEIDKNILIRLKKIIILSLFDIKPYLFSSYKEDLDLFLQLHNNINSIIILGENIILSDISHYIIREFLLYILSDHNANIWFDKYQLPSVIVPDIRKEIREVYNFHYFLSVTNNCGIKNIYYSDTPSTFSKIKDSNFYIHIEHYNNNLYYYYSKTICLRPENNGNHGIIINIE